MAWILSAGTCFAQSPSIGWWKISSGGGQSQAGSVSIVGTIGQADASVSSAGGVTIQAGFWSLAAVPPEPSEVLTWTNTSGGNWMTAKNWSPNKVPTSKHVVLIHLPGTYTVTLDYDAQCKSLLLGGGAGTQSLNWDYGGFTGSMLVETNAVVNLVGGSLSLTGVVDNRGRINWPAGHAMTWRLEGNSKLLNRARGLLDMRGTGSFYSFTTPAIVNEGVMRKSSSSGEILVYKAVSFVNAGTIDVQTGSFTLNGLESSNVVAVANGAGVKLLSGTFNFLPGHAFAGSGTWWIAGSPNVNGLLDGNVVWTVSEAGKFDALLGTTMWWTNGNLGGNLTLGESGVLNLNSMTVQGAITNHGRVKWAGSSARWFWNEGARMENMADGVLDVAFDTTLYLPPGAFLNNRGALIKSGGVGHTSFRGANVYTNFGLIDVDSGTLEFLNGLSSSGMINVSRECALKFPGGTFDFGPNHKFTGAGHCVFGGSSVRMNGPLEGTVGFEMVYDAGFHSTLNAPMLWTSGNQSGDLTIGNRGVLTLAGPGSLGGAITNYGVVVWQSPANTSWRWADAARFHNASGALFDMRGDFWFYGGNPGMAFYNAGTFRKSQGVAAGVFDLGYSFVNSGTLDVQSGKVWFRGPYSESAEAGIGVYLGGPTAVTQYSQVEFDQPPVFEGRFGVTMNNSYRPSSGTSFTVLTFPSQTGTFSGMSGLDLSGGLRLVPQYSATALNLVATQNTTPALAAVGTSAGGSLRITWPADYAGWELYSATNLTNPVWRRVPVTGGAAVELPTTNNAEVFRLRKP